MQNKIVKFLRQLDRGSSLLPHVLIDFPGIPKELTLLQIQFLSIKFIKSYKNLIQIELVTHETKNKH